MTDDTVCWELFDAADPLLDAARALYESTLEEAERIPWEWLARTPERRKAWRPGQRCPHLVLAARRAEPGRPVGFAYGTYIPGYGGYVCYLGVEPTARGQGIGSRLFEYLFQLIACDAAADGKVLPFMIWESHPPADAALWRVRLRLFEKVGGLRIAGVEFFSPNYMQPDAPPVPLQLFLRPWAAPVAGFDAAVLRGVVGGLYHHIYRIDADDPLRTATLAAVAAPRLVPAVETPGKD